LNRYGSGDEEKILAPWPLDLLPGLEASDILHLQQFNITRIGELAALSPAELAIPFGRRSGFLHDLARGIDFTPVSPPGRKSPAIEEGYQFPAGSNDLAEVEKALFLLVEKAGNQLRRQGLATGKIAVALTYSDHAGCSRQTNLTPPSADDLALFTRARHLLHMIWHRRVRLAGLRLICHRLAPPPPAQLNLFDERQDDKRARLLPALDTIRRRFGNDSVRWGKMQSEVGS
jgi:DNA polymerase-4